MWPLLRQALYKRKLHRLCLNNKWTFVGNSSNKVLINPYGHFIPTFHYHKTPFYKTLLFVEYIYILELTYI